MQIQQKDYRKNPDKLTSPRIIISNGMLVQHDGATGAYEPPSADEYLDSLKMTLLFYESSSQKKQIVLRDYDN